MKLVHLSDLHIGKRILEKSLLKDQQFILNSILDIIDDEKIDGVIIAGDVFDKGVPSENAVTLFDDFLTNLNKRNLKVFIISGNHDSPERIDYAGKILSNNEIHIYGNFD